MKRVRALFPLLVIVIAYAWSAATVALRTSEQARPGVKVIRLGHWQLEGGVRDAFDRLGSEFAARPDVKQQFGEVEIRQEAIPEGTYGQWITTQMIAGTAPDLVEVGAGLPTPIWLAYQNRYFEPLTAMANAPNPFNRGTALEGVPLKNTLGDGMRSGYQEELQDYTRVPLTRFTSRVFYNADLLRRLTGLDEPPTELRGFLDVCRRIAAQKDEHGEPYVPIASSKYHVAMWQSAMFDALTYDDLFKTDFNRDGTVGSDETFAAFRTKALSFDTPSVRAKFEIQSLVQQQFQSGYTGLTRDEAVFLFAQQRAVFMCTGTWDVGGLVEQAAGKFRVRAMVYPMPTASDAAFGPLVRGPVYDPAGTGLPMGITRFSKNPELARAFLLFLSSREGNARLNEIIGWIPSVVGAPMPSVLKDFAPVNQGMYAALNLRLGGETVVRLEQDMALFQTDPTYTYDKLAQDFGPFYLSHGLNDWQEAQRDWRRKVLANERLLAAMRGEASLHTADDTEANGRWERYRTFTATRQVFPELSHNHQVNLVSLDKAPPVGPYEYSALAERRIKDRGRVPATRP